MDIELVEALSMLALVVVACVYMYLRNKKNKVKNVLSDEEAIEQDALEERIRMYERLKPIMDKPETVRIATWIEINSVNGEPYSEDHEYLVKVSEEGTIGVALFQAGDYDFVVSSYTRRNYKNIKMKVSLQAGEIYQLGCNQDGPYLIVDPNPKRYDHV